MATEKQDALARKILNTFAKKRVALVAFGLFRCKGETLYSFSSYIPYSFYYEK